MQSIDSWFGIESEEKAPAEELRAEIAREQVAVAMPLPTEQERLERAMEAALAAPVVHERAAPPAERGASYAKLRDGGWGIRVVGAVPIVGETIVVRKRDGSTKTEVVSAVVARFSDATLCAVVPTAREGNSSSPRRASPRPGLRRGWRPCGYPGCSPGYCDECDGEGYRSGR